MARKVFCVKRSPQIVAVYARVIVTGHGAPPPNPPAGAAAGVAGEGLDCSFAFCVCGALGKPGANDVGGCGFECVAHGPLSVCSKFKLVLIGGGAADGDGEED